MNSIDRKFSKGKKLTKSPSKSKLKIRQVSEYLPFLKKCHHIINEKNTELQGKSCFLCRITNHYIQYVFYSEENKKKQEQLLSFNVKKRKKKIFLLFLWAHCQSSNYLINNIQNYVFYDLIFSSELLSNCSRLIQLGVITNSSSNTGINALSSKSNDEILNFNFYFKKIFYLRKLAIFGNFAAIFIQSHVRKLLAKLRVRKLVLLRFEYINDLSTFDSYRDFYIKKSLIPVANDSNYDTVNTKQYIEPTVSLIDTHSQGNDKYFFFYDTKTKKRWERYPLILKNEAPGTPRTINRRLQHEEVVKSSKLKFFNEKILKEFNENINLLSSNKNQASFHNKKKKKNSPSLSNNSFFLQRELDTINYIKNLAILYDMLSVTFFQMKEQFHGSQYDNSRLRLVFSSPSSCEHAIGLKIAMHKNQNMLSFDDNNIYLNSSRLESTDTRISSVSKSNLSSKSNTLTSKDKSRKTQVALVPSKPGTPINSPRSRPSSGNNLVKPKIKNQSDNPGLDLLKNTFKRNIDQFRPISAINSSISISKNNSSESNLKNITLQNGLQRLDELVFDSLNCKDANEVLENILNPELNQFYSRVNNIFNDEVNLWNCSRIYPPQESTQSASSTHEDEQNIGILPFYFSLKKINSDHRPNGLFRLFFLDEELICVSSISPFCYYPEVYKNKDMILSSILKFILTPEVNQMIQDYYYNARLKFHPSMIQQVTNNSSYTPLQP